MMTKPGSRGEPRHAMIDGVTVRMGGREWIVPPLTLGQLRRLWPRVRRLGEIGAVTGAEEVAIMVEVTTAALSRNYPDLTAVEVEELLDLGNAGMVLNAVLTGSGLRPATGEAEPAAVILSEDSAGSTAISPPAADTPSP